MLILSQNYKYITTENNQSIPEILINSNWHLIPQYGLQICLFDNFHTLLTLYSLIWNLTSNSYPIPQYGLQTTSFDDLHTIYC